MSINFPDWLGNICVSHWNKILHSFLFGRVLLQSFGENANAKKTATSKFNILFGFTARLSTHDCEPPGLRQPRISLKTWTWAQICIYSGHLKEPMKQQTYRRSVKASCYKERRHAENMTLCTSGNSGFRVGGGGECAVTWQHGIYFEGHPLYLGYAPQLLTLKQKYTVNRDISQPWWVKYTAEHMR